MSTELVIPKIGMTMEEGTLVRWLKAEGATVSAGEPIFVLVTDKVETEVEAEASGRLQRAVQEGATLPTGAVVGWLLGDGDPSAPVAAPVPPDRPPARTTMVPQSLTTRRSERSVASPNARRLARELSVDLHELSGTGPGGRILGDDVVRAAAIRNDGSRAPTGPRASAAARMLADRLGVDLATIASRHGAPISRQDIEKAVAERLSRSASPPAVVPSTRVAMTGMRATIARRMHQSLQDMAQLTVASETQVDGLVGLREDLRRSERRTSPIPTVTDFVIRATALALQAHPALNASVVDQAIERHPEVHIGVAVATEDGLVVPVVRNVDRLTLTDIAITTKQLAARAQDRRLIREDLEGATFCVTSLGSRGVDLFTPVINPPNVAILGVGRIREVVRFGGKRKKRPKKATAITLSLTFDHRALDGAPAAEFLSTVCEYLARPAHLL